MPLVYITGAPGVGKSSIQNELSAADYEAYDIDDRKLGGPYNKASGKLIVLPPADLRTPEWFSENEWRINVEAILQLKTKAKSRLF